MVACLESNVTQVSDVPIGSLLELLGSYGLSLIVESDDSEIRGSFWGDREAGVVGESVFVRNDTPIHSLLHETCHIICMTADRRAGLDRDAGGDDLEESAVCYLQIVLADYVDGVGRSRMMFDMDSWGYSFRLGNTRDWFESDADDALEFLLNHELLGEAGIPTFHLRA